jgi:phosphate transport system substrate-binding protein
MTLEALLAVGAGCGQNHLAERRSMEFARFARIAAFAICGAIATGAQAADISGAGATFPYPLYAKWADTYKKDTGIGLNYQSIGSGGGIKQIQARTVTFGASDMPLEPKELAKAGLVQFPTVVGGAIPVVNLDGVNPGDLVLDGPTLADIYLGKITKWDDPAIQKLNPKLKLPSNAIAIVHRSDGSGTTFIFTNYLSKVSKDWEDNVGSSTSVQWPSGIGAKGNEGVANNVIQTKGAIGYVEYAYVKENKMNYVTMINSDGKAVKPDATAFQAAAGHADWAHSDHYYVILTNEPGPATWPIAGATFILIPTQPTNVDNTAAALKFFDWAYTQGGKMAEDLDYVPLPKNVVDSIKAMWAADIKGPDGKPVFVASK